MLISVMPPEIYRALGDAALVSEVCFLVGLVSLRAGLMVPCLSRFVARRWIYAAGCLGFACGAGLGALGGAGLLGCAHLAGRLHPRLGTERRRKIPLPRGRKTV